MRYELTHVNHCYFVCCYFYRLFFTVHNDKLAVHQPHHAYIPAPLICNEHDWCLRQFCVPLGLARSLLTSYLNREILSDHTTTKVFNRGGAPALTNEPNVHQ